MLNNEMKEELIKGLIEILHRLYCMVRWQETKQHQKVILILQLL